MTDPLLLTPGPLTTSASTKSAMLRDLGSRDGRFLEVTRRVRERLVALAGGSGTHSAALVQGSGTFAVEAAIGTFLPRGGRSLVLANGAYGRRMADILRTLGRDHAVLEEEEHRPFDPARLDRALAEDPEIGWVLVVYTETTTGMKNPLDAIAEVTARHGRRLLVDAMSAFGAMPLDLSKTPIDVVCASSNKCLEGVPGVGFAIARTPLFAASEGNAHSLSLDLAAQWRGFEANGQWRFTPPTHVMLALDQALAEHAAEGGVAGRFARYEANRRRLIAGMSRLGFETLLHESEMSPTIVTFRMPDDPRFKFETVYARLSELGFVIYPGKLTKAPSFRIGCIGQVHGGDLDRFLGAFESVLGELGITPGERTLTVNGKAYRWPTRPTVVICADGCAPEYLDRAIEAGRMPNLARMVEAGTNRRARAVIPSFTNPNNVSIVTGVPPSVHGIPGNYFIDPATDEAVMMNDPKFLRAGSILAAFANAGAKVVAITAKDKLRTLLGHGWRGICFSAEKADQVTLAEHGITGALELTGMPRPDVYSAELSFFVLAAGVALLRRERPELMYLSTTDYVQHKHAPGTEAANRFYAGIDRYLGELHDLGATVVLTADHGMSAKTTAEGAPNVLFLGDLADDWLGAGRARVILPITDPYVVHHGALGSFAFVHARSEADRAELARRLGALSGIELVLDRAEAARRFELPADRIGDLAVVSARDVVLGTHRRAHDLSGLDAPLRSHGGTSEEWVPLIANRPLPRLPGDAALRNFSAFDVALNYADAPSRA